MTLFARWISLVLSIVACCEIADGSLVLNVSYSGDMRFSQAFEDAKSSWETRLIGYIDGTVLFASQGSRYSPGEVVSQVFIDAQVTTLDGPGGVLGTGAFTKVARDTSGFLLATDGTIRIDEGDAEGLLNSGNLANLITHEMAHVLGFGSLWGLNGVYQNDSGVFTGANATAAWQSEFGQTGAPAVELDGGSGTANSHWNETLFGAGLTGITDSQGRDMRDELMTGWLNPGSFISDMTVASFADIGFTTSATAVPEPSSVCLLALGTAWGIARRRKRDEG